MGQRRAFGNIRKLSSGRWQASYLDPVTRQRVPGETTFATKADANRWLSTVEVSLQVGDALDRAGRTRTLRNYSEKWMEGKSSLRPKTRDLYQYLLDRHILPLLGAAPLTRISPTAVRDWNTDLRSGSISDVTAAKAYRLLRQILEAAVEDRLIGRNPCRIKGAATERSAERKIPSVDQVVQLAGTIDRRFRAMVLLAAFAGLRRGECLALTPEHVALDGEPPTVTVAQSLVQTDGSGFILQPPKTAAGARTIAISETLAREIAAHLSEFPTTDNGFLFPYEVEGVRSFRQAWEVAARECRVSCSFHDLRHVAGTLNAVAGASLKESMARMGHASPDAALRYQHAFAERDAEIADSIERFIGSPAEP